MSEPTPPTNSDTHPVPDSPVPPPVPPPQEPRLQREAVVLVHDRGRLGVMIALCTLAGVVVGFILGTTTAGEGEVAAVAPVAVSSPAPIEVSPHHGCDHDRSWAPRVPKVMPHGLDLQQMDARPWLGVQIEDGNGGASVTAVAPGSPAEAAGIEEGDVIRELGGEGTATASQLTRSVRDREPGDEVEVVLERNGAEVTLEATLGKLGGGSRLRIR